MQLDICAEGWWTDTEVTLKRSTYVLKFRAKCCVTCHLG